MFFCVFVCVCVFLSALFFVKGQLLVPLALLSCATFVLYCFYLYYLFTACVHK